MQRLSPKDKSTCEKKVASLPLSVLNHRTTQNAHATKINSTLNRKTGKRCHTILFVKCCVKILFLVLCGTSILMMTHSPVSIFHNTSHSSATATSGVGITTDGSGGHISISDGNTSSNSDMPILFEKPESQLSSSTIIDLSTTRGIDILDVFLQSLKEPYTNVSAGTASSNTSSSDFYLNKSENKNEDELVPSWLFNAGNLPSNITVKAIHHLYSIKPLPKKYVYDILTKSHDYFQSLPLVVTIELAAHENMPNIRGGEKERKQVNFAKKYQFQQSHKPRSITVVGDTHGQLFGVIHIFKEFGFPTASSPYIFNGDIFDKGDYSFQLFLSLLMIKLSCPSCIFFNRGNHDTEMFMKGSKGKMKKEIISLYGEDIYDLLLKTIYQVPVATLIDGSNSNSHFGDTKVGGRALVLHAGLSASNITIEDMQKIEPGHDAKVGSFLESLLWAYPQKKMGIKDDSQGAAFGPDITKSFLERNDLDFIIRGHTAVKKGYRKEHDDKVITVHSATHGNRKGAIVKVSSNLGLEFKTFSRPYPVINDFSSFANFEKL